jgi:hypothetical protein
MTDTGYHRSDRDSVIGTDQKDMYSDTQTRQLQLYKDQTGGDVGTHRTDTMIYRSDRCS